MLEATRVPETGEQSPNAESLDSESMDTSSTLRSPSPAKSSRLGLLHPLRHWLDSLEVRNAKTARRIAKLIPAQCPFERDVKLLGHTVGHIPPLCKLNPLYDQFVTLRFRALCYLADECGEDIRSYC